jgi:XTP/dITP diphosphohydrolase
MHLVIGTTNLAKGRELVELLGPYGFQIQTLQDFDNMVEVVEDGDTFAANAQKKAREFAQQLNHWVLADDSGLEVDALGGKPGIYSARFAGESATDEQNNARLLADLAETPEQKRGAHYACHVAVADPSGAIRAESSGVCCGRIRTAAAGTGGFGYDPLFELRELHRTFGQMGPHIKAALSHRGRAMRAIVPQLIRLAATATAK